MNKRLTYVRFCYWLGAFADLVSSVLYLVPSVFARQFGIDQTLINETTTFVLGHAAALMIGWTFLLVWADRDPIARKGVLLLTAFPVIVGMLSTSVYITYIGFVPVSKMIGLYILQTFLLVVFCMGYIVAGTVNK